MGRIPLLREPATRRPHRSPLDIGNPGVFRRCYIISKKVLVKSLFGYPALLCIAETPANPDLAEVWAMSPPLRAKARPDHDRRDPQGDTAGVATPPKAEQIRPR